MFRIERIGSPTGPAKLISDEKLQSRDFDEIEAALGTRKLQARKLGFVAARQTRERLVVETRWNGKESTIAVEPGDWIVTNMTPKREFLRDGEGHLNVYAIRSETFPTLYERDGAETELGDVYRALGTVEMIFLPAGFEIVAPWGEKQHAEAGYLLRRGHEVYGNNKETFERTYVVLD